MSDDQRFQFTYSAPTAEERRQIEGIRSEYLAAGEYRDKLTELRQLDKRAKRPASAAALSLGVVGILVFGLGMSMLLSFNMFAAGVVVSAVGLVAMGLAYPVHALLLRRGKAKYGPHILKLSEELLHDGTEDMQNKK